MKIINTDSIYRIYPDNLKTYDSLPVGVYRACFSKMEGFFLEKQPDVEVKEKIYGKHEEKVNKILRSFDKFERNLGVIFSGNKGIGKSVAAKLLAKHANEKGLPVILINEYLPGVSDLLNDIEQEVVVIFDEFDKTYSSRGDDGNDKQTEFLSLLDGFGRGKKLYVVTCNNLNRLNDFLVNRPGRFHYHIVFGYPTEDEIKEYLHDKVDAKYHGEITKVIGFSKGVELNYDCLRAIAFELNSGIPFEDAISDINIVNFGGNWDYYIAIATMSDGSKMSIKKFQMDAYSTDEDHITFYGKKYKADIYFTPAEHLRYDVHIGEYVLDLDSLAPDDGTSEEDDEYTGITIRMKSDPTSNYDTRITSDSDIKVASVVFKKIVDKRDGLHYAF